MTDPTDPTTSGLEPLDPLDPLDELASAYLDGETSDEETRRVTADPALQARVRRLLAVRDAVRADTAPVDPARRDAAVQAALAAAADDAPRRAGSVTSLADVVARRQRPSPRALRLLGAAAAVVLVALAIVPVVRNLGDDHSDRQVASSAPDTAAESSKAAPAPDSLATEAAGSAAASDSAATADATPLGSFADLPTLTAAVRSALAPSPTAGAALPSSGPAAPTTTLATPFDAPVPDPAAADCLGRAQQAATEDGGDVVLSRTALLDGKLVAVTVIHHVDRPFVLLVTDPAADCAVVSTSEL